MSDTMDTSKPSDLTRRKFLSALMGTAGTVTALAAVDEFALRPDTAIAAYEAQIAAASAVASADPGRLDVLERMRAELLRALQKPAADRRWVMVIDLRKCVGCHACTVACVAENKLPPGVVYRPVFDEEFGTYPNVGRRFMPRPCMQCDNPPCTPVCPVNATYKNDEGIVAIDYDQCIGCRACLTACPYGARTMDFGYLYTENTPVADGALVGHETAANYERAANFEYGKRYERNGGHESPIGNARKCQFCEHRIKVGELPACVTTCIGRATLFGDANDPNSLVSEMVASPHVMRLKEELGTEPRVYYLV